MPTVPEYPEEDWMQRLGRDSGSRQTWRMPFGTPSQGGGDDYGRWNKLPHSENVEDRRDQPPTTREPGEPMANWSGTERYAYQHHYNNLQKGGVKQKDDSTSTYRAIGVGIDGKHYMLPTIWDNKQVSNKEAIKRAKEVGLNNFPSDKNRANAEQAYEKIHKYMMEDMTRPQ